MFKEISQEIDNLVSPFVSAVAEGKQTLIVEEKLLY